MIIRVSWYGIYAMAEDIAQLYRRMDDYKNLIHEHIGKCVIWGQDYKDYDHWVNDEIATWIDRIARKKSKSKLKMGAVQEHF